MEKTTPQSVGDGERCEVCRCYRNGDCRRNAPVVVSVEVGGRVVSAFPEVDKHMWCAQFWSVEMRMKEWGRERLKLEEAAEHPPVILPDRNLPDREAVVPAKREEVVKNPAEVEQPITSRAEMAEMLQHHKELQIETGKVMKRLEAWMDFGQKEAARWARRLAFAEIAELIPLEFTSTQHKAATTGVIDAKVRREIAKGA